MEKVSERDKGEIMSEVLSLRSASQDQAQISEAYQHGEVLQAKYGRELKIAEAWYAGRKGKAMPDVLKVCLTCALENLDRDLKARDIDTAKYRMMETSTMLKPSDYIAHGFDVNTALLASLSIEDVVSIQPMDRAEGRAFFLNFTVPKSKGTVKAGSFFLSAKTGHMNSSSYSTNLIDKEDLFEGDGSKKTFKGAALAWLPAIPSTIVFNARCAGKDVVGTYNPDTGNVEGDGISGKVNPETGEVELEFNVAVESNTTVWATYRYDMDRSFPPEVDLEIASIPLMAESRKLRTRWMMDQAIQLKKAHGKDSDTELLNAIIAGVNHEISIDVFNDIYKNATASDATFDLSPSSNFIMQKDWNEQIVHHFIAQSNAIYDKTKRAYGNVIVGGINLCNVVEALPETYWKAAGGAVQSGPYKIGTLAGKFTVIKNFNFAPEAYFLGYKSENYLDAGYVWAPFIPVMTTNPVALDDLKVRRGLLSMAAKQMLNSDFYARGSVETLAVQP